MISLWLVSRLSVSVAAMSKGHLAFFSKKKTFGEHSIHGIWMGESLSLESLEQASLWMNW